MTPALAAAVGLVLAPAVLPVWPSGPRPSRVRAEASAVASTADGLVPLRPRPGRFVYRETETAVDPPLEIAFLANARPVRVRAAVLVAGRPPSSQWRTHVAAMFSGFDRDKDGHINRTEYEHLFTPKGVRGLLGGSFFTPYVENLPEFSALDRDGDGKLAMDELFAFYAPNGEDLFAPRQVPVSNGNQVRLTKELFNLLDRDRDGRLTRDELKLIADTLTARDKDEDECLSFTEILPSYYDNTPEPTTPRGMAATAKAKPSVADDPVLLVQRGELPGTVMKDLLTKYDRNGDGSLTAPEVGFPPPVFRRLDRNGDGRLSPQELDAWRTGPPEYTAVLDLYPGGNDCRAELSPLPAEAVASGPGRLTLRVGNQFLDLSVTPPGNAAQTNWVEERLRETYPPGVQKVTEGDIAGPQYQYLRIVYDAADLNGDGVLTRDEFRRYLALQQSTIDAALTAAYAVRTPGLFQLMDENGDGRLSVRELRTAYDRLKPLDPEPGVGVSEKALQPNAGVRLGQAAYIANDPSSAGNPFEKMRSPSKGPTWFVRMDRNGDGDVSRLEFLGDSATFAKIDTDGDGLISPPEATAFDAAARPKK